MTCPCEGCKEVRAGASSRRARRELDRIEAAKAPLYAAIKLADDRARIFKGQLNRFESLLGRIEASKNAEWITGDGSKVRVQVMNDSHLFYAIAKGMRGEYGAARTITHLKNEALRRLIGGTRPCNA